MKTLSVMIVLVVAACGGPQKGNRDQAESFDCKERRVSVVAVGTLMYQQQSIFLTCESGPRVDQSFVSDDGSEKKAGDFVAGGIWNDTWQVFENAGWRNLKDCDNAKAGDRDAMYTFEIAEGDYQVSFTCQGNELPFPYDTLRNAMDSAAGALPSQE